MKRSFALSLGFNSTPQAVVAGLPFTIRHGIAAVRQSNRKGL